MPLVEQVELKPALVAASRRIHRIVIDLDQKFFEVDWMYQDADGVDIGSQTKQVQLTGEDFLAVQSELTLDGESLYDAVKRISYSKGV